MLNFLFVLFLGVQDDVSTRELVSRLGDSNIRVRESAAWQLVDRGVSALEALRSAKNSEDREIRARVGQLLQVIETIEIVDIGFFDRFPAAKISVLRGDWTAPLDVYEDLKDRNSWWIPRQLEAYAIRMLGHTDIEIRRRATEILDRIPGSGGNPARRPTRQLVKEISRWTPEKAFDPRRIWLKKLGLLAVRHVSSRDRWLFEKVEGAHPQGELVLRILGALAGVEAHYHSYLRILENEEPWLRYIASSAARKPKFPREAVTTVVGSEAVPRASGETLFILDAGSDPAYRDQVVAFVRGTPREKRFHAHYQALSKAGGESAAEILRADFEKRTGYLSLEAAKGLVDLGRKEAFATLFECRKRKDQGHMFVYQAGKLADKATVHDLLLLLESKETRQHGIYGIQYVKDPEAARIILDRFVKEQRLDIKRALLNAIDRDPFVYRDPGLVADALEKVARRADDPLRQDAARNLIRLRGKEAATIAEKALLESANPSPSLFGALAMYPSDRLLGPLVQMMNAGTLRGNEYAYLERLGTARAKELLLRSLDHKDKDSMAYIFGLTPEEKSMRVALALDRLGGIPNEWLENFGASFRLELRSFRGTGIDRYFKARCLRRLMKSDYPGLRERLSREIAQKGVEPYVVALSEWAPPDAAEGIKVLLARPSTLRNETGSLLLEALVATGDLSAPRIIIRALRNYRLRKKAIELSGRLRLVGAVKDLKRIVRAAPSPIKGQAITALAEIGARGTADFLRIHLRDNPRAGSLALARLGATDAARDIFGLLEDGFYDAYVAQALDLLVHHEIYSRLDRPFRCEQYSVPRRDIPAILEDLCERPLRITREIGMVLFSQQSGYQWTMSIKTMRGLFIQFASVPKVLGGPLTHLYRDGAIEIVPLDEALKHWQKALED